MKKYDVDEVQSIPSICAEFTQRCGAGKKVTVKDMMECGAHIIGRLHVLQEANAVPGEFVQEFLEWIAVPEEPSMADAVTKKWRAFAATLPDEGRREEAAKFYAEIEKKTVELVDKYKEQL